MSATNVLVEVIKTENNAFEMHSAALVDERECEKRAESLGKGLSGLGLEIVGDYAPVPLFAKKVVAGSKKHVGFESFSSREVSDDVPSASSVIMASLPAANLKKLAERENLRVWPNSELTLYGHGRCGDVPDGELDPTGLNEDELVESGFHPFDLATSAGSRTDCRPFRPGVAVSRIRDLLTVEAIWRDGFRGQNIVVGILDEGVNGIVYPVIGGFSRPGAQRPGSASIRSHGSMCAADVLVAAPAAKIFDYPFLGVPNSGGAIVMLHAALTQRRINGTPHVTNNSYGFVSVPPRAQSPNHEIWNIDHPFNRKVREVVSSGAPTFFAAGNCGADCPSGKCRPSSIGAGQSIHAANSLKEVVTVAAVNSRHERIGYSSQGPGMFEPAKPDIAAYSHFFGNFGPGRPGGSSPAFDNGTSAATPVAAGVAALLMSALAGLSPSAVKAALMESAIDIGPVGWDPELGRGVINAGAAYGLLKQDLGLA